MGSKHDAYIRDLVSAFAEANHAGVEWWETFESKEDAWKFLGKLWNCTEIVRSDLRQDVANWLDSLGAQHYDEALNLRSESCKYTKLVRLMRKALVY